MTYWPPMRAVKAQERKDLTRPIKPKPTRLGLIELRPLGFLEMRTEYGAGHAWRMIKIGRLKVWLRAEWQQ